MKLRYALLYTVGLLALAAGLFVSAGGDSPAGIHLAAPAGAGGVALPDLTGDWSGGWVDTLYSVGGSMTMSISRNGDQWSATGTIDVSSINPLLGFLAGSATGTSSASQLAGSFSCTDLGSGTFSIDAVAAGSPKTAGAGVASGSGNVGAPLSFGPFVFEGTATDDVMAGIFDFTSPTGGAGVATLVKVPNPVEPTSWGQVKSLYGD